MYTWEEELTEEDSKLFEDARYIGRVFPAGGSWQVNYQADPDSLPPNPETMIAMRPDKRAAQTCLVKFWEATKKQ